MKKLMLLVAALSLFAISCKSNTTIEASSDGGDPDNSDQSQPPAAPEGSDPDTDDTGTGGDGDGGQDDEPSSGVEATDPTPAPEPTSPSDDAAAATPVPTEVPADVPDSQPVELDQAGAAAIQAVTEARDWCEAAQAVEETNDAFDVLNFNDPVELERGFTIWLGVITAAKRLVPDGIADDLDQSIAGFTTFANELAAVNWSFLDLDLSVLESVDGPMELATYNIEVYNFTFCGIGSDPGAPPVIGDDGSVDTGEERPEFDGSLRDQAVQGLVDAGFTPEEAGCIIQDLDISDPAALSDPGALLEIFTNCGISLDRLSQLGG